MRKLVATLACRNLSTRLYGKPLQNIDVQNNLTILEYMIKCIKISKVIDEIVLAISETKDSYIFIEIAKKHGLKFILGDEEDVLSRLIKACIEAQGTDIYRVTTESPFSCYELISSSWDAHKKNKSDLTALDGVPDGVGFEIISIEALQFSWNKGNKKHKSELCTLYIRENLSKFKVNFIQADETISRTDIRLTVDNPEDLILIRFVYEKLADKKILIPVRDIIKLLDENPYYKNMVKKYVDKGLSTMYIR